MRDVDRAEAIEREFLRAAVRRSALLARNDAKQANKEYDRVHGLKDELRLLPDRGVAVLRRITLHPDPHVQVLAAAALLAVDEPYAVAVLAEIAERETGIAGTEARLTIEEWRAGHLQDHWG